MGPDVGIFDPSVLQAGLTNAKEAIDADPEGGIIIFKDKSGKSHFLASIKAPMKGGKWKFLQVVVFGPHGTYNCGDDGGEQRKGRGPVTQSSCMKYYKGVAKDVADIVAANPANATRIVILVCFANTCITNAMISELMGRERVKDDPNKEMITPARDMWVNLDPGIVVDGRFVVLSGIAFDERTGELIENAIFPNDVVIYRGKDLKEWPPFWVGGEKKKILQRERGERRSRAIERVRKEIFQRHGLPTPKRKG